MSSYTYESGNTHCICFNCNKNRLIDEDCSCGAPTMRVQSKRNLMSELTEGIDALAERKDLEEWAFYESGLVAHGCLENIDEYMREAITRYGRLLLSKQKIKAENLEEDLETLKKQTEQCILMADKFLAELMKYREL